MCTIFHFLNNNSGVIQAILVLILVSVTIWYAISTKKMADIMHHQFLSSMRPYLYPAIEIERDFIPNYNPNNNYSIQLKFLFTNVGSVPVNYYVDELILNGSSINPPKTNSNLFPGQKSSFGTTILQSNTNIGQGDGLKGNIKLIFWSGKIDDLKYFFKRDFTLSAMNVVAIDNESYGQFE
jgi:hypothetical protein